MYLLFSMLSYTVCISTLPVFLRFGFTLVCLRVAFSFWSEQYLYIYQSMYCRIVTLHVV